MPRRKLALAGGRWCPKRGHQVAAAAVAMTALTLAVCHLFETTTFDMLISAAALRVVVRALRAEPQRWAPWITVGLLAGVAMKIKILNGRCRASRAVPA